MELQPYYYDNPKRFKDVISQSGGGLSIDRYIYNQKGHGIGTFFAKLFNMAAPIARTVARTAINTGTKILKPHMQKLGNQALAVGTQIASDKVGQISNQISNQIQQSRLHRATPSKKRTSLKTASTKSKKRKDLFDR